MYYHIWKGDDNFVKKPTIHNLLVIVFVYLFTVKETMNRAMIIKSQKALVSGQLLVMACSIPLAAGQVLTIKIMNK